MALHENFQEEFIVYYTPKWFKLRSELYAEACEWKPRKPDEIFFHFKNTDAAWMDFDVYVNGEKKHECYFSAVFNPFHNLKVWMEDIVNDFKMSSTLPINIEGRTLIFHYENIKLCEISDRRRWISNERDKDEWELTDANTHPTIGLFYIYDSACKTLPVVCMCQAKQLVSCLYNALLRYAIGPHSEKIAQEWYDDDDDYDNWYFYNTIKSPLIEWFIYSKGGYRHQVPQFTATSVIKEAIHMWTEWGDGLFWSNGLCCGNAEGFVVKTDNKRIDLTDIPELRVWYDEFDNSYCEEKWSDDKYQEWLKRGWELAQLVRKKLPDSIDLFYQWKEYSLQCNIQGDSDIPFIVPNENNNL